MIKKELSKDEYVVAIEVNKNDFGYFNEKDMYSINVTNIQPAINKFSSASMVLVDLNNTNGEACDEVIYLIEPSTIKLNKMTLLNKDIFDEIYGKRIVLNKSLLTDQDVSDFEFESHSKVSYNMPPLNDRADNSQIIKDFINKLDL